MEISRLLSLFTSLLLSHSVYAADSCQTVFAPVKKSQFKTEEVMDISRTEKTLSYVTRPASKSDIATAIATAKAQGLKITIKGTNHSHGGHNRRQADPNSQPRAVQLDMLSYNKILSLDPKKMEVTVEAGVTWKDLSIFLNEKGFAAMTEQSSNIFSIGGSVATNIHGRDIHGPLSTSVKQIKFIDHNGTEHVTSMHQNRNLFRAIMGGYGGLGVITEITLKIEKNYLYQAASTQDASIASYVQYLKDLRQSPSNLMHYGRVNMSGKDAFTKMSYVEWRPVADNTVPKTWPGWDLQLVEKNRLISSGIMNLMRSDYLFDFGKWVKDLMDKHFGLPANGTLKTKNNILNNPVQFLFDNFYNQQRSVDILQEYFIPVEKLEPFLQSIKATSEAHALALMNVTMRYVPKTPKDQDGLLSPYSAEKDLVAVVLYFNVKEGKQQNNGEVVEYDGSLWTQEIIGVAHNLGGSFYWPYHRWWTPEQITHEQKESIREFFRVKDKVDPDNVFESDFHYHLRGGSDKNQQKSSKVAIFVLPRTFTA